MSGRLMASSGTTATPISCGRVLVNVRIVRTIGSHNYYRYFLFAELNFD